MMSLLDRERKAADKSAQDVARLQAEVDRLKNQEN